MYRHNVNGKIIEIALRDITESDTTAIVNAANTHLWMGAGVAGAIKRKGGIEIEKEAMQKGPIQIGEVVTTSAGRLPMKYVIHAPAMEPGMPANEENISKATKAVFAECQRLKIESVTLPALGAGVGGVTPEHATEAMMRQAINHIRAGNAFPKRIVFVGISKNVVDAFEKAFQKLQK